MSNISRRQFLGLGATTAASLVLAGCGGGAGNATNSGSASQASAKGDLPTVRVGMGSDGQFFNAIADHNGYLKDEGVNVEENVFSTSDDAFQALFSGKVDVLTTSGTNLPLAHIGSGQDLVMYAGYMLTGCMPIFAKKGTEWHGVEDLVGKTIACSGNEFAVFGPLVDSGHSMSELKTIVLSNHADRVEAVRSGEADYGITGTSQNYNIQQHADELDILAYCSDITPDYSCCRVESTGAFLDENEDAIKAMLRAWLRAQEWYEGHKDEAVDILNEHTNSGTDYIHAFVDNPHFKINVDPYKTSIERAWKWMGEMDVLPDGYQSINIDDHIRTDLYKDALDKVISEHGDEDKDFYDKMTKIYQQFDA